MSRFLTTLLAGAALFVTAGAAYATTLTYTASFTNQTTDFGGTTGVPAQTLTLTGFDTSLGTLTKVVFSFGGSESESGTVTNTAAGNQTFTAVNTSTVSVAAANSTQNAVSNSLGATISNIGVTLSASQQYTNLIPNSPQAFGPFTPSSSKFVTFSTADGEDLSPFYNATSLQVSTSTLSGSQGAGGNANVSVSTTASGSASVTYTYTAAEIPPTTVPEPATMALLGAGLMGAGLLRRRAK